MKTFNQYVNEETMPFAQTDKGFVGIDDPAVRDNINTLLDGITSKNFVTPYIGLERVSKVLANFHIFVPKYTFAGGDEGVTAFEINQFGPKIGMTDDGQVKTNDSSPYYLYFEYRAADDGMFGVFASVVTEDELDDLMSDYEEEEDEDEDEGEEMNEEKMTDAEMKEREKIVKSMKKNMAGFKERYGKDAESVMYATATKQAMKAVEEEAPFEGGKKKSTPNPESRTRQLAKMAAKSAKKKAIKKVMSKQIDEADFDSVMKKARQALGTYRQVATNIGKSYQKSTDDMELNRLASKPDTGGESIRAVLQRPNRINEVSKQTLGNYLSKRNLEKGRPGKKKAKSMELAIGKMVNNPKYLKVKVPATEETHDDEGWYTHKEIHGNKAVSKDEWKKGIRMNRKGEKVQTKKLDEVSKKTLASYIKGATHDVATRSAVTRGKARDAEEKKKNKDYMGARKDSEMADKMFKKSWKRREGIAKAADKLAKEETQIDEISKEKLSRYVDKAPQSASNMSRKSVVGGSPEEKKKFYNKIDAKIDRRLDYVGKAIKKIKDTKD